MTRDIHWSRTARSTFSRIPARLLAIGVLLGASRGLAAMQTTITRYQYNGDHALTAMTTAVNGQSTTVYFTWDDCLPSAANPTSCTVSAGNGNLLGFGSTPGSGYTTQFTFDQRNRLTGAAASGAASVSYTYHPASLMATATLAGNDALAFTYDVGALPVLTNIEQASTRKWTSYFGDTTYVSDGTEQVLCQPRKDVAGIYEPATGRLTPLRYDPYGTLESSSSVSNSPATGATTYDLTQNPFQYDGEYTDPAWGGVYLRARWYLPPYGVFLARDPVDPMHRYGYAGGNPLVNVDPSGLDYRNVSRAIERAFHPLTSGVWGYVVPLVPVIGQIVGGATLLANVPQLWHHGSEATWINFGFLGVSAAMEGGSAFRSVDAALGHQGAFALRHAIDAVVGGGQTAIVEAITNKGKVDAAAVIQSAEYSVGAIITARDVGGIGYRPYRLSAQDIDTAIAKHSLADNQALVYRVRFRLSRFLPTHTSPLLEASELGFYHEGVLAVRAGRYHFTELVANYYDGTRLEFTQSRTKVFDSGSFGKAWKSVSGNSSAEFEYVGKFDLSPENLEMLQRGDPSYPTRTDQLRAFSRKAPIATRFKLLRDNCQSSSNRVIQALGQPQ